MENVLLILSSVAAERKKILDKWRRQKPDLPIAKYEAGKISVEGFLEELRWPDLFTPTRCLILEKIELLKKEEAQLLMEAFALLPPNVYLILSGSSFKGKCKNSCDFTQEKPWEKPTRLKQWLQEEASLSGKTLSSQLLSFLIEEVSQDFGQLQQELFKLIVYVGERSSIDLKDAKALILPTLQATGWQIAEAIVWEKKDLANTSFDISFIGQIRYHLQLGQQIASLMEKSLPPSEILAQIPQLKPKALEKYYPLVKHRGKSFFVQGLQALFACELKCKTSSLSPDIFWELFKSKVLSTL